ncbi:MAG: ABC transporter permease [Actinomycetia bacterium]|nr:ABC transporter permease [Actinomycetes bacterium]
MGDFASVVWDIFTSEATYTIGALFAALLLFGAAGELVAERAGTINISVEGMLLAGAFGGAVGFDLTDSVAVGVLFGIGGGMAVASVQAEMSHRLAADQFVVGLTLNILVLGLVGFLDHELAPVAHKAAAWRVPLFADLPLVGEALFGQPWPFYLVYLCVPVTWWLLFRTRWGLEVRSSGEDPRSADLSGIDVNKRRRQSIYLTGLMSGLGGAFLLFAQVGVFDDGMVGGRGFIAIAAVIFGGWTLKGTIAGSVLFASALSFRLSLQAQGYEGINSELLQALPFLLTIAGMAIFAKRVRPPAALARPFIRGLK